MKKIILAIFIILAFVLAGCGKAKVTGEAVQEIGCTDTDGGNNINKQGTVNNEFSDKCVGNILIEYYCEDNKPTNQNQRCQNKCVDGACV